MVTGGDKMLTRFVQVVFLLIGSILGIMFLPVLYEWIGIDYILLLNNPYVSAILGAIIFYIMTFWAVRHVVDFIKRLEELLLNAPILDLIFGTIGAILGLLVAFLLNFALEGIRLPIINDVVPILLTLIFGYLGFRVGFKKRDELINLFASRGSKKKAGEEKEPSSANVKLLDTSVIIDGRIADICKTGFLEGTIVIPQFVLEELQHIADSSDVLKRNRGRRGLDILNKIQKELPIKVEVYEGDFEDIQEVDSKLVKLAKLLNGTVVTNDFNLNKVCELHQVKVLNINDLANALKPVVLPGEEMVVHIIKDGKEQDQ